MADLGAGVKEVYFQGNVGAGVALTGEVAGRIDAIRPVSEIIAETVKEYVETIRGLSSQIPAK